MRVVCCLLSAHVVKSVWVERELVYALNNSRYEDRIIPVLYEPCHPSALFWERQGLQSSAGWRGPSRLGSPPANHAPGLPVASAFGIWRLPRYANPLSFTARTAASKPARVSAMTSSVWQVPARARPPLKSIPCRIKACRRAPLLFVDAGRRGAARERRPPTDHRRRAAAHRRRNTFFPIAIIAVDLPGHLLTRQDRGHAIAEPGRPCRWPAVGLRHRRSIPWRIKACRRARLCCGWRASRRCQGTSSTDWSSPSCGGTSAP